MFDKKYNPQSIQQEILGNQNRKKLFGIKALKKSGEKNTISMLYIPTALQPETTSYAELLSGIQQDTMVRYLRMIGKQVSYRPFFGYKTSSNDNKKENIQLPQWHKEIHKQKEKWMKHMLQLGFSCDQESETTLVTPLMTRKIRNMIFDFMKQGRVKKDDAINYWSNRTQTNIAPDEIVWKRIKDKIYNLRYFVDTKNITLIVTTTNPETIFGDVALAVHPDDRRYKKLIGHKVIIPIVNKTIPIIGEETVDITKDNGVVRICPCHDRRSLEIAKKHGLKTNKFAIDHNSCFTKFAGDFAGKKVTDFFDNIIQNLDDIHNMESVQQIDYEVATDKYHGEKLQPILSEQRFFYPPAELIQQASIREILQSIEIQPSEHRELREETADNTTMTCRPISKKDPFGISLPVRQNEEESFFLGEQNIINLPVKKKKGKKTIPALLLFNLVADGQIQQNFTIEQVIDCILAQAPQQKTTLGEEYIQAFKEDLPRGFATEINEFTKLFEYANKDIGGAKTTILSKKKGLVNYEKFSDQLMTILEKTCLVTNKKGGKFFFDISAITNSSEALVPSDEKIDNSLATSLMLLDASGLFDNITSEKTYLSGTEKDRTNILKTILLGKTIHKKTPIEKIVLTPPPASISYDILDEMMEKFGSDVVRLYSILPNRSTKEKPKIEDVEPYNMFVSKTRNACRYIYVSFIESKKKRKEVTRDLDEMQIYLEKRINKVSTFEYWMLCRIKELHEEMLDSVEKNTLPLFAEKLLECIKKDFCDKFLEVIKIQQTDLTETVAIFCVGMLLKMLHPMIPFMTETLRGYFNFQGILSTQQYKTLFQTASKNYKTQLFMDIMDKFSLLRDRAQQLKHQKVDICFSASIDFLHYIQENEEIVEKLVNTSQIKYVDKEKDLQNYETENIIDVVIGIKAINRPIQKDGVETLQHELHKKNEELQYMRSVAAQLSLQKKEKKIINAKKEEMAKLKEVIEKLEYEIKKIKMNEK